MRIGRDEPAAENAGAGEALLASWGVTVNKDLVLDISGVGQIFGLGPEVPLVASIRIAPHRQPTERVATAFPLARSLDVKSGDKTTVEKLFATSDDSVAVTNLGAGGSRSIPRRARRARSPWPPPAPTTAATPGRFVVVGTSLWAEQQHARLPLHGNRDLFREHDQLAVLGRGPDFHPAQGARRPAAQHQRRSKLNIGVLAQRRDLPAGGGRLRHGHLVEEEIAHEAEGTPDRRRSFGCCWAELIWWSNKKQAATPARPPTDTTSKLLSIPDDQFQEIRIKKLTGEAQDLQARERQVADHRAEAARRPIRTPSRSMVSTPLRPDRRQDRSKTRPPTSAVRPRPAHPRHHHHQEGRQDRRRC